MQPSTFILPTRLAAYLRDSGGERQELSLPQQEAAIRQWCLENCHTLTYIFQDAARAGSSTVGRAGFLDCMHHFRSPGCRETGLVIWSYSRFARDIDDAQFYRADLRRRGYQIISITDQVPDGPIGRLFEAAIDWKNEQFLEDLSRDVKRGLADRVSRYGAIPGTPPRGFKRQPVEIGQRRDGSRHIGHRWVPDPDQAPLVQKAFRMRAAGKSLAEINAATHLYKGINGYKTFYSNRLYIGELHFGELVINDYCEPLVDRATWDAVQAILERHKDRQNVVTPADQPRRKHTPYLLSGLVYCARCDAPLSGLTSKQRNGGYYERYCCSRWKRNRDCDAKPIPRQVLEDAILEKIQTHILNETLLASLRSGAAAHDTAHQERLQAEIGALKRSLANIRLAITRITDAIIASGHSTALLERLTTLEHEQNQLITQIERLETDVGQITEPLTQDELEQRAVRLKQLLKSKDPDQVRTLIHGLIDRITVARHNRQITGEIIYYYPPPKAPAPLDGAANPLDGADYCAYDPHPRGGTYHRHSIAFTSTATAIRKYSR